MLAKRIIPCLDVKGGRVVKGVRFVDHVDAGDPVELASRYDREGADELVFYDITASAEGRPIDIEMVREVARRIFIPFSVGGGIRDLDTLLAMVEAGATRIGASGSAALVRAAHERFSTSTVD